MENKEICQEKDCEEIIGMQKFTTPRGKKICSKCYQNKYYSRNLRELLNKIKDEKALNQWHFHVERLLEALVEEAEKKQ